MSGGRRWLVALDIDGTLLHETGTISPAVAEAVRRVEKAGNEVMLATGRSVGATLPVLRQLGIRSEYVICSNGAITLKRDPAAGGGYRREFVETFDPTKVLTTIRHHLPTGRYAVEDEWGNYRYTEPFPDETIGAMAERVPFEQLLHRQATRVVVVSPDHDMEEFLGIVERMGLHRVSYFVGWTAWLDIAPDGVNKSTAVERVREELGFPRSRVFAMGDGRNDIDLLAWAGAHGRSVAMGQAPDDVKEAAVTVTGDIDDDGAAEALLALVA